MGAGLTKLIKYNKNKITDDSDGYIVCVPTPSSPKLNACDMSIVWEVVKECPDDKPILIKSTISLEGYEEMKNWNKRITFSPEFKALFIFKLINLSFSPDCLFSECPIITYLAPTFFNIIEFTDPVNAP